MTRFKNITVVGAGAIGGAVAFALSRAGFQPKLLTRGTALQKIRAEGLSVDQPTGSATVAIEAGDDAAAFGPQDLVIGTMKAYDWAGAIDTLRPLLGPSTVLVPMLNGIPWWYCDGIQGPLAGRAIAAVDPDGRLKAAFPAGRIIGCVNYMGSARLAPNRINWTSGKRLAIGEATGPASERLAALGDLLGQAGFDAVASDNIRREIWTKLLGNASFNPLSVITGATMDRMVAEPGLRRICAAVMAECKAIAEALGAPVTLDIEARLDLNRAMVGYRPSTAQDFEAGRPLELGGIVDTVVELGRLTGSATPMTETLATLARERALARQPRPH